MTDNVGQRLKRLRLEAGWSQADLARLVKEARGLNWLQTTVQKNEAGSRPLTLTDLEALADVFGMSLDAMLYGDDPDTHEVVNTPVGDYRRDPDLEMVEHIRAGRILANRHERQAHVLRIAELDAEHADLTAPPDGAYELAEAQRESQHAINGGLLGDSPPDLPPVKPQEPPTDQEST